jgi:hypothetical protein
MEEPLTTYFMERELHPTRLTTLKRGMGPILPLTSWNRSSPYQAYNIKAWNVPIGPILSYNTSTLGIIFADSTGPMFFSKKWASLQ